MMKTIRTLILALLACFSLVAQAALSPAQVAALKLQTPQRTSVSIAYPIRFAPTN